MLTKLATARRHYTMLTQSHATDIDLVRSSQNRRNVRTSVISTIQFTSGLLMRRM